MLNFGVSEKGQGKVSPTHFVYNFSRRLFQMLCSIKRPNLILGSMCIIIVNQAVMS